MRILGSLILLSLWLFAGLKVYLQQNPIYLGEPAKLVIEATGDEIELPQLDKIGPYPVTATAKSESVVNIDGNLSVKKSEILTFYPNKNMTIPPITVKIDGEEVQSEPIELIVKKGSSDQNVVFTLQVDKKNVYVGEPLIADLMLKIKRNINIVDYSFVMPKLENFWVKQLKSSHNYLEEHGAYLIKHLKLLLIPQKSGDLVISPAIFKYAVPNHTVDTFGFSITAPVWKSVFSNEVRLHVKPLPQDVDLVGDFTMKVTVDKNRVKANEPVNLKIVIDGEGNIENFDGVDLDIPGVTVYKNKPIVKEKYTNGHLQAHFEQTFSLIANHSFIIDAINIPYFSLKEKKIKMLQSKPIKIEVEGGTIEHTKPSEPPSLESSHNIKKNVQQGWRFDWISFAIGLGAGVLLIVLGFFARVLLSKRGPKKLFGDRKELLKKLLPYVSKDKRAAAMAQALWEEIESGKKSSIKRKDVEKLLEDLV
ncbi:BatD family protein [Nitratiruptor sp. YY09-18]|uniref:BatD family protein n=1 Tax=Nitratiruptor sp. YY09-18 TaxID=2724901 RepID=UPI00191692A5|nr:BatD family protein [Nitratiruptor sp. YY09-18]BCD67561.1 hypothetical protein NitYY0918_C0460 [Nitratiruptor sp. YY09-18]